MLSYDFGWTRIESVSQNHFLPCRLIFPYKLGIDRGVELSVLLM